ncbi:helix-turn-helix protein [Paraburkholderia sp. BL23I1N1]|uniref:HAD domain-containing protein n=1 Tax=Paraburkholderia sp. BL23I1N1 TaxID=1938802 RepID=UPI000E735237|nr:HAD domain-containing protein [Paraburkholderia sp. BL23I1N1]RKE25189.1 helix-turn-helix protein [Paraburkholderia sp. BL23I1N1]
MPVSSSAQDNSANPLAFNLPALGKLVKDTRLRCMLNVRDAADSIGVSSGVLTRIENGKSVRTERLFKVLTGFGLAMLVMPRGDADIVTQALGQTVNWHDVMASQSRARKPDTKPTVALDMTTPTLFVDYDGTLHAGHAFVDERGQITLDSGRPLFEFAPLLIGMLEPYPAVQIVLTTSWLQTMPTEIVISYLPPELARRVVDTTRGRKARFSYMQNGSGRTDIITCYAFGKGLKNWLALDDSVYDASNFGREPGELVQNFVLLDSTLGISDEGAQQRVREWLVRVHNNRNT